MVGDFVTDSGQSVVLSGETLSRASDMSVSLPDPSEMDSLLLDDTGGNGGDSDDENGESMGGNGESMGGNRHETGDSGSDNGESAFDYDWCEADPNAICTELPEFQEPSGPSQEARNAKTPLECFQLFFTTALVTILITQTNLYADQLRTASAPSPSNRWYDVSMEEILAYLGIHIAMGIVNLPSLRDFWSSDPILQHQWFPSIMSRDRFKQILRYFHCADSNGYVPRGEEGHDPLYKLREIIDILTDRFKLCYNPGRELSIDESMIGTKCRVPFLQYMPKKPTKWGIKVWVCADANTAYVQTFCVYTGKDNDSEFAGKQLAYRVVMKLLQDYLGKHYKVYFDNFYTSPHLVVALLKNKTYSSGTVRPNRKHFPADIGSTTSW